MEDIDIVNIQLYIIFLFVLYYIFLLFLFYFYFCQTPPLKLNAVLPPVTSATKRLRQGPRQTVLRPHIVLHPHPTQQEEHIRDLKRGHVPTMGMWPPLPLLVGNWQQVLNPQPTSVKKPVKFFF